MSKPPLPTGQPGGPPQPVRRGQQTRGSVPLFWATFASLNIGLWLAAICEPLYSWTGDAAWGILVVVSALLYLAVAAAFGQYVAADAPVGGRR